MTRSTKASKMQLKNVEHSKFQTTITILPDEIIFDILLRLPAHELYDVMRFVCRQWRRIIEEAQFVSTHFQLASDTLLMYSPKLNLFHLLDVREFHAKLSGFELQRPPTYDIYVCNGLMLFLKLGRLQNSTYYVGNPVARRLLALPQFPLPIVECGIAFETSSKVYKVVLVYWTKKWSHKPFRCAILTVGIDESWRFLKCAHLKEKDMRLLNRKPPITSTDFVYWVKTSHPYMLALDLKCETMKRISLPSACQVSPNFDYLSKGNSISVWHHKSDGSMDVWLLKDYISEEWVKFLCIDGETIRNEVGKVKSPNKLASSRNFRFIIPRCWLGNGDKILFDAKSVAGVFYVYDLKTRGCCLFDVEYDKPFCSILEPFVNSLTWIC